MKRRTVGQLLAAAGIVVVWGSVLRPAPWQAGVVLGVVFFVLGGLLLADNPRRGSV